MPPMPAEAEAPPDLATPLTAIAAASAARAFCSSRSTDGSSGSIKSRSGKSCASWLSSARPANLSSGAARAMATARSASARLPSAAISLVETTAWRRPTSTRRPRSSLSARSLSSTAPSRTSIDSDIERTATASAASAPALSAALTSRSARSVRAVWSNKEAAGACIVRFIWAWIRPRATADPNILRPAGKVSSIMVRNVPSIMRGEAGAVTSG